MDIIFNELSFLHKAANRHQARDLMKNLLLSCKTAIEYGFFNKLRINPDFFMSELSEGYSVNDWLNDHDIPRDHITLLLGLKRYPYIDEKDVHIEDQFIQNNYFLIAPENADLHNLETEGLAVAFLYNTLAISLKSNEFWQQYEINLRERVNDNERNVQVKHCSSPENICIHDDWIKSCMPIVLLKSSLVPAEKNISLRDDHGKDILQKFSSKLVESPYVNRIINSLPFNPRHKGFFKKIFPDGKIEIVLSWTDQGLGCIVQTTGRNLQETKKIAEILKEKFGE